MPFDPDAYLKGKIAQPSAPPMVGGFDPDAYLKRKATSFDPNAYLNEKLAAPTPAAPPEESGFLRQAADIPIGVTKGIATGVRMIADAFGAGSDTSKLIKGYEDQIGSLLSAQAKNDQKEISRILKDAQDKGVLDQLVAAGKAFATAPIDLTVQALGTSAPALVTGLATTLGGAPTGVALGASAFMGSVMGAGEAKGGIYEATREELLGVGVPKDKAEQIAIAAQEYGGKNLDQILLAAGLGAATSATGFEASAIKSMAARILSKAAVKETAGTAAKEVAEKGLARSIATGVGKESIPEFFQGSQIQLAENLALQREGFDVPTTRGLVAEGALEALSSMPLGAYAGYKDRGARTVGEDTREGRALSELDKLAAEEEKAEGEKAKSEAVIEPEIPRRPADLTPQEISNIERRLYAELGREPNEFEFEEAINDYLDEQNAGGGTEPGAGVAGVSDISEPEATGVPDTTVATTPESGGLDTTGGATTVAGAGEGVQPGALEEPLTVETAAAAVKEAISLEGNQYTFTRSFEDIGEEPIVRDVKATRLPDGKLVISSEGSNPSVLPANLAANITDEQAAQRYANFMFGEGFELGTAAPKAEAAAPKAEPSTLKQVGQINYDNNDVYTGELVNGKPNGKGLYKWSDGAVYDGEFVDGNFTNGTLTYADGYIETGIFKDDELFTGQAITTNPDGSKTIDTYENNKLIKEESNIAETPTGEKRDVATYLEGYPQETKRYNTYINNPEVGPLLQSANAAIQKLTDFINSRGFSVREVNRATPDREVQRAKDLASAVSGIAARLLTKQDAVDRSLKRANPEQLQQAKTELEIFINDAVNNFLSSSQVEEKPPAPASAKPTFVLPDEYAHGTDYLTAQNIIRGGRLIPDAGKRMYSYSQFGRKAVYLTARNGWWLDADKAAEGRAAVYDASVPFKLDPKAKIREVNTPAELDAIAREIGEPDGTAMMRKLSVENLDYEQEARKVKGTSFEDFVKQEVNRRRERLKKVDAPDADTVTNIDSWVAQQEKEYEDRPEFIRSKEDILSMLREQYDFLQNYENEYKDADEVTQKLIDAGIDGIYVGPNFGKVTDEERAAFDKVYDETAAQMQGASPSEIYDTATAKYSEVNPTYFDRAFNPVATDQLALFRPELAVVDRARLAATRPAPSQKPAFAQPEETAPRVDSISRFPLGPTSITPTVIAENKPLYRETNASGVDDFLREDMQFGYAPVFVTDNPDIALGQQGNVGATIEFRPNSVSGKVSPKPVSGELTGNEYQADVIAPKAIQSITFASQKIANQLLPFSKRALQQNFTKEVLPDGKVKYTRKPTATQKPALSVEEFKKKPGETEDDYVDRVSRSTGSEMAPNIVEMLRNNDLNGALREVANILPGFNGTLANRLAQLNLPSGVRIGDQRNLTRRSIDHTSGAQQIRLFGYLRTAAPDFFNKYFNQYDRAENLELVYEGLTKLPNFVSDTKLGPVRTEYDTVLQSFEDNMLGLSALGAYYPVFDEINLNDTSRAYGTGMRRDSGLSYRTFLHETVHAATELLLLTPRDQRTAEQNAAVDELERLYEYAIGKISGKRYGFTNLSEFIAEIMTNRSFQNELKAIPYPPTRSNIFTRFVQAVLKLVGLDNVAGRAMVEAERLFNIERPYQVLSAGPRFAQAPKKRRVRGPISTPDTYRTAESQQNTLNQTIKDAYEGRMPWAEAIKILGPSIWDAGNTILRKAALPVMNLTQLEDLTRTKFTQITGALKIIRDMVAYRAKKMNSASEIMRDWTKAQRKNFAQSQLMGRIMMEATIRGIDPDTAPVGALNKPLQDAWNTLQPEFKAIYRRVRDFYADSVDQMVKEMERRASANPDPVARAKALKKIKEQFGPDKLVKPYFPLRRFGQYYYQVGSGNFKEFYEFEDPFTRDAAMRKRIKDLSAGNEQQRKLAASIQKGNGISELYGKNISTTQALKDVQDLIDNISATDTADLKDQLKDSLNQLIYILLPQQSVRKMFINRKAIQGASTDMLRVFATTAVHSAYQQSRFMYSEKFLQNLNNARSEIDDAQKTGMLSTDTAAMYKDFILEVEQRVPTIMSNEDTSMTAQVAGKASELTFYYMLSAPFTALLNTIGAVQLAMPYIGGSYGYARANALLVKNMGRYLATSPTRTFSPLAKRDFAQVNFPSIAEGRKLPPLLQKAADRFIDDGVIDISLTNDIFELGERPSALYTGTSATIKKIMSGLFHQSERMNREIVLLTTFELAYDKFLKDYQRQPGMEGLRGVYLRDAQGNKIKNTPDQAFELAIEEATRVTSTSLGDYSRQTKGRIFANPIMNLLLKFKQYPILAMYSIMRNFHVGVVAPFKKAEMDQYRALLEKELKNDPNKDKIIAQRLQEVETQRKELEKEGRRRLAGILGVTTILGGVAASPFFSLVVGTLVKMFAGEDDDDYFDWENWFYNYMEGEFGGYAGAMLANAGIKPDVAEKAGRKVGEAVSRGLPAAMGAAVADRVSLDPKALLWRDGRYSPDARENFIESLIANAGPVVGLGFNFVDSYQLAKEGQYARAVEKAVPAIIAKPASAIRMGAEGAKTKGGDVLVDDFTASELAMQSLGLQPERLAQRQKATFSMKQKEQKILDERAAIMNRLWMERDTDAFETILERAATFSEKHPTKAITFKNIKESFEKRAKRAALAESIGANIDKKLIYELSGMGEFAED